MRLDHTFEPVALTFRVAKFVLHVFDASKRNTYLRPVREQAPRKNAWSLMQKAAAVSIPRARAPRAGGLRRRAAREAAAALHRCCCSFAYLIFGWYMNRGRALGGPWFLSWALA